jgi:hypothetical protein
MMPALVTTLEVFCLRTGKPFRVRGNAVRSEYYQRPGWEDTLCSRELVACRRCSDTHLLLSEFQAASFGLLQGAGEFWTRWKLSHGRRWNRALFDRKRFPPVEPAAAA